jgi:hypothetical protein
VRNFNHPNRGVESSTPVTPKGTNLIHGDQALADAIHAGLSTVRTLRAKRIIPYIKTGYKSVIYDLNKVMAALEVLETKAIERKGMR